MSSEPMMKTENTAATAAATLPQLAISMRPGKLLETLKEIDRNPEQDDQSNDSRQRGDDRLDESVSPDGAETESHGKC